MTSDERREIVGGLHRTQRLILKRAYAKSKQRPLMVEGPNMAKVAGSMVALGYLEPCRAGVVLTAAGFRLAAIMRVDGWPNCEKVRK